MIVCIAGKGDLAIHCFEYAKKIVGEANVITLPVEDGSLTNKWMPSFRHYCQENNIKMVQLEELYKIDHLYFFSLQFDKIVNPSQFLSKKLFNIHFSLLPEYRGLFPVVFPILHGRKRSGVTLHKIDQGIDTGDIIAQEVIPISETTTSRDLYFHCIERATEIFKKNIKVILDGDETGKGQDHNLATYYSREDLDLSDINIDCNHLARSVIRKINAYSFKEFQLPVFEGYKIERARLLNSKSYQDPGTILFKNTCKIIVATRDYDVEMHVV